MVYREPEEQRTFREKSRQAVKLAMDSRWEEAAALNRELTAEVPDDLDSFNRLGRALMELGDVRGARSAFERSLTLDPSNGIAKKNLERLGNGSNGNVAGGMAVAHRAFIGEAGKSAQVMLLSSAPSQSRPYAAPGAAIDLQIQGGNLVAFTCKGEYLGLVPPGLGRRLVNMMEGGNQYSGAVVSMGDEAIQVLLLETFQHPSMRAKISFPMSSGAPAVTAEQPVEDEPDPLAVDPADDDEPVDLMGLDLDGMESDGFAEMDVEDIDEEDEEDEAEGDDDQELEEAI